MSPPLLPLSPEEKEIEILHAKLEVCEEQIRKYKITIRDLEARVPRPRHTDTRKPGELQHQSISGQQILGFNG